MLHFFTGLGNFACNFGNKLSVTVDFSINFRPQMAKNCG